MHQLLPISNPILFWDCELSEISAEKHADFIIFRILEYGTINDIKWVINYYGLEKIKEFIKNKGIKKLSKRTLRFWQLVLKD